MKKLFFCLGSIALFTIAGCKKEESVKIGVINMSKVFASHPALKLINPKVNAQKSGVEKKVQEAAQLISQKEKKFNAIAKDKEIELVEKQALAKEIHSDRAKLNQFVQQGNLKLGAIQKNVRNQLLASLIQQIEAYRVEKKYSFIFDYSGMTGNNMGVVVCFDKSNDITDDILSRVTALKVNYKQPDANPTLPKADAVTKENINN